MGRADAISASMESQSKPLEGGGKLAFGTRRMSSRSDKERSDMIESYIRGVPDFPSKGVMYRDITTLFQDASAYGEMLDLICAPFQNREIEKVVGLEARGFIVGAAVASRLGAGFVAARKGGKLPRERISQRYELEYGSAELELHCDSIPPGANVLLVDDLLATGGTASAGIALIEQLGGVVEACAFVVNLPDLGGATRLASEGYTVHWLCEF